MKILLVDDDSFLRDMYATKFKEDGHDIHAAASGEEALKRLSEDTFDIVLLDMVMPGITGVELLSKVTTEKLGGNPACIVLSNQGEETDMQAAKKAGAVGYIVKAEMVPSEVVQKVKEIFDTTNQTIHGIS